MSRPFRKGFALFAGEVVFLVDPDDTPEAPARMIERALDRLDSHAKPCTAARENPPQVMNAPCRHSRQLRGELRLRLRKADRLKNSGAAISRKAFEDGNCRVR